MQAIGNRAIADAIMYMPLDTTSNARFLLNTLQPSLIIFSRSELWYNYLREIQKRGTAFFLISALISTKSKFIRWPQKALFRKCVHAFTKIYCQTSQTKDILENIFQYRHAQVVGNTRIDRIFQSLQEKTYTRISQFVGSSFCVIGGSCLDKDENILLSVINKVKDLDIKWLIVPHEINEKKINRIVDKQDMYIKYSNIQALTKQHKVLYIDSVGDLKYLYQYADLAIIGGGFNKIGIHNILEPAYYGVPMTFGPNHRDYQEAIDFLNLGFAVIHHNTKELQTIIGQAYQQPISVNQKSKIRQYIKDNVGASEMIVKDIDAIIGDSI